ncbi:Glycoside hydrolase superfamily,Beta-galactosidase 1-like,Glycoside hydrolase, family [Cinara cedri]|uniref:Glycoside hydrolase superfamily,Beta-galactosidase 1-like,Glycoside hydrolase, family n=1 Tax=Cinara cedri TaxID=506608 RepID=A0A5E4MR72_9HEMI|nr:Glycoside hydrolase superfamily,Beta-galactosidase 1-like,Glycoside hydrolase, family [Cinara cedri]
MADTASGCCNYVEWSMHEPYSGVYDFKGQADLEHFLNLAEQEKMLILLRPGPFISAERDFGGYPYWLLKEKPRIRLRSSDPSHTKYVRRWFSVLMPKIVPRLYGNGGNIIMIQIENEYGHNNLSGNDQKYIFWLRDLFQKYVHDQALLFTTDECDANYMEFGHIPNVYSTTDFAPSLNATECFGYMRQVQKRGPLVNSEFYVGWIAFWDEPRPVRNTTEIIDGFKLLLSLNASINIFMFHGGTNFGFTSGAHSNGDTLKTADYKPELTSYDFSGLLDEAGDPTEKYYAFKKTLKEANFPTFFTPKRAPKGNYGTVNLLPVASLLDRVSRRLQPVISQVPLCFEDIDQDHGLVLYETNLPTFEKPTKLPLIVEKLHDRAIIFLNTEKLGIMSRSSKNTTMELLVSGGDQKLSILVEDQGRVNDKSYLEDRKGILSNVTLGKHILGPWVMTRYPLNETSWLNTVNIQPDVRSPAYYKGIFIIPQNKKHPKPLDTYLDTSGWSKGVAFINGINIGRYWPAVGPQITLYVPAPYLVPGLNTVVMVELENPHEDFTVKFVDSPRLDW